MSALVTLIVGIVLGWLIATFRNPICAWAALRDSVKLGALVVGHRMIEQEQADARVTTLKCERCDKYLVTWRRA